MHLKTITRLHLRHNLLFLILIVALSACDNNRVYEENLPVPGAVWNRTKTVSFSVPIEDTVSMHNVYINVRHNGKYEHSNLFLFVNITSPDKEILRDTIECVLADEKGNWLGSGLGDLYFNQLLYKNQVVFPRKGNYVFEIEQAMRINDLKNIEDVGVRVELAVK